MIHFNSIPVDDVIEKGFVLDEKFLSRKEAFTYIKTNVNFYKHYEQNIFELYPSHVAYVHFHKEELESSVYFSTNFSLGLVYAKECCPVHKTELIYLDKYLLGCAHTISKNKKTIKCPHRQYTTKEK